MDYLLSSILIFYFQSQREYFTFFDAVLQVNLKHVEFAVKNSRQKN